MKKSDRDLIDAHIKKHGVKKLPPEQHDPEKHSPYGSERPMGRVKTTYPEIRDHEKESTTKKD